MFNPTGNPLIDGFLFILFVYPIASSFVWFVGALCYQFVFKYRNRKLYPIAKEDEPFITILIAAHNEEIVIEETLNFLMNKINYHNYEVLVVNDGSTDQTLPILERLLDVYPKLRIINIEKNKGKAHALNIGTGFAKGDFILSNDADTIPEPDALWKYMNYFIHDYDMNIAGVTGNMDVQNRTRIIEKAQTVEFSSIVGIIKRSQMATIGSMYAYSGANTMYRKAALVDVGLFRQDRATEDISIVWDQQKNGWFTVFAPDIMFFMNVPSSIRMLYRQRKRWGKGGIEVWLSNFSTVWRHPFNRLSLLVMHVDQTLSLIWTLFFWVTSGVFIFQLLHFLSIGNYERIYHMFSMALIFVMFEMISGIIQLTAALMIDNHGNKLKYFIFSPFYMLIYWQVNALSIVTTFIPAIKTILGYGSGTWKSPERKVDKQTQKSKLSKGSLDN